MKYVCLVYGEQGAFDLVPDSDCVAYDNELRDRGRCLASEALEPAASAVTVRVRAGRVTVSDGPFAETKETLAGFYLVEAADLNEAIQLAAAIPAACTGSVEVRPVRPLPGKT
ncbi:MAG: YciI family protein [Bryobacteraceae bacterium]|nr:YciI family protein [Bryobacteraceae bacterium]